MKFARTASAMSDVKRDNGFRIIGQAFLGDGEGNVVADKLNRLANYWEPAPGGELRTVTTAYLWVGSQLPFENISASKIVVVDIGYPPNDDRVHILWQNGATGIASTGGYTLAEQKTHAAAHQPLADVPDWRATVNGTEIKVAEGKYIDASGDEQKWYGGSTNAAATTLATRIAALTSGQHQLCWITFNLTSGILVTEAAAAVTAVGTLPSRGEFLDAHFTVSTTNRKLFAVYLYYGQTLAEADIYRKWDMRFPVMEPGSGVGGGDVSGPASSTDEAIARWDGTGGDTLQDSVATIDNAGLLKTVNFVFNDAGADVDSRTEGDNDPNLTYWDAGNDRVAIGTSAPDSRFLIVGRADEPQLAVKGNATQNQPLAEFRNSSSTVLHKILGTGHIEPGADNTYNIGSSSAREAQIWGVSFLGDKLGTRVKNTSGSTANANHVGYITYTAGSGPEYKTTTTANLNAAWCVVLDGGANNADIYVATTGVVTIELNGNCSAGDLLATSTTAGRAAVLTLMRPEMFAIALTANAGGAGGTCSARLYCNSAPVGVTDANYMWSVLASNTTLFVATINGAPSATSVTYNAPSSGNENCIVPGAAGDLLKMRLHNTTRGTYRLITAVNTGTNVITTVSSTDAWASGDTITIESQTVTSGASYKFMDIDFSQTSVFPTLMRYLFMKALFIDTGAGNRSGYIHPYETFALSKIFNVLNPAASAYMASPTPPFPIINRALAVSIDASGTGTGYFWVGTYAAIVAAP